MTMSDPPETAAEAENLLKSLIASRRGRLGACMRRTNEIKALMTDVRNVDKFNDTLEAFKDTVDEFKNAHRSVQELMSKRKKKTIIMTGMNPE